MGKNKCKHNAHHFEMDTLKVYQPSGRSITNTRHYTELSDILVTIDLHQHTHTHIRINYHSNGKWFIGYGSPYGFEKYQQNTNMSIQFIK